MLSEASFVASTLIVCRSVIGLIFAFSCVSKAVGMAQFVSAIRDFAFVSPHWSRRAAYGIVVAEGVVALSMAVDGPWLGIGFALALALLLVFSIAVLLVLLRRRPVACNCFGHTARPISVADLVRNSIFLITSGAGLLAVGSAEIAARSPRMVDSGWLVLLAASIVVVSLHLHDLAQLYGLAKEPTF